MPRELADVAAELYALRPEEFVTRRTEEAKAARADGDRALAASIGTLRKPTVSAWVLNRFVRSHGDVVAQITAIGKELREAESAMSADDLRRLSTARNQLVESLTHDAVSAAGVTDPAASLVDEVRSTLAAAVADQSVAEALASGALVKAAVWSGFGATDPEELAPVRPAPPGAEKKAPSAPTESKPATTTRTTQTAADRRRRRGDELRGRLDEAAAELTVTQDDLESANADEQQLEERIAEIRAELAQTLADLKTAQEASRRARRQLGNAEREHQAATKALERHEAQS